MIILPSIDLMNDQCVRLKQGDFEQQTTYNASPVSIAREFKKGGAPGLHVVDLQGAKQGSLAHLHTICALVKEFGSGVQVGGGIRTPVEVEALLAIGVERIVLGTRVVTHFSEIESWIQQYGQERFVFALDVRFKGGVPFIATSGWTEDSELPLWTMLDQLPQASQVLCTDISCDGMQKGPNIALYQACIERYPYHRFQASGGIGSLSDVRLLKAAKLQACVIGKALYENTFSLSEALAC